MKLIENILINSTNASKEPAVWDTKPKTVVDNREKNLLETSIPNSTTTSTAELRSEEDPLSLTNEDPIEPYTRESIIKSPIHNSDMQSDAGDEESSDMEDVKPTGITLEIEPVEDTGTMSKVIEVKVENASWTDTDYTQPFFRDSNGLSRQIIGEQDVVEGDSITEATTAIKLEMKSNDFYECPHCGILFKSPKRFLIHAKWHDFGLTNEKRTEIQKEKEAKKCEKREAKIVERMNAREITDPEDKVDGKTWPCKDCDKVFSAKGSLKNHRQRTHPTRIRECKICHKSLVGWVALRNHMSTHAGEAGVGFQCNECPKRFKYLHSLAKHSDTHLEKVHACADCPKKFGSQALLKMHMKTHERQSRGATFRCTYCAKGFFEAYSLAVHERTHRNERPFLCEICNTSYGTNSSLKRHLKVSHSTSKPFVCSVCHRSFTTEPIRDRHEQRLHGKPEDFKFPCKQCACKYMKLKDLQKHVYKAHPKNKRRKKNKSEEEEEQMDDTE